MTNVDSLSNTIMRRIPCIYSDNIRDSLIHAQKSVVSMFSSLESEYKDDPKKGLKIFPNQKSTAHLIISALMDEEKIVYYGYSKNSIG